MYRRLKCLPDSIPGNQPHAHTFTGSPAPPPPPSSLHLCTRPRLNVFVNESLNDSFTVVTWTSTYKVCWLLHCSGCCRRRRHRHRRRRHWILTQRVCVTTVCVDAWVLCLCVCVVAVACISVLPFFSDTPWRSLELVGPPVASLLVFLHPSPLGRVLAAGHSRHAHHLGTSQVSLLPPLAVLHLRAVLCSLAAQICLSSLALLWPFCSWSARLVPWPALWWSAVLLLSVQG